MTLSHEPSLKSQLSIIPRDITVSFVVDVVVVVGVVVGGGGGEQNYIL